MRVALVRSVPGSYRNRTWNQLESRPFILPYTTRQAIGRSMHSPWPFWPKIMVTRSFFGTMAFQNAHTWIGYRPLQALRDQPHSITIQYPWVTTTWLGPPAPASPPPMVTPQPPPLPASSASATAVDPLDDSSSTSITALDKKHKLRQLQQRLLQEGLYLLEKVYRAWFIEASQV